MPVVPGTHTFVDAIATSSEMNTFVRDPALFMALPPMAELRQTTVQSLTTAVFASINFDVEDLDSNILGGGQHDTAINNSRFTCLFAGWYLCSGGVGFLANATGRRSTRWAVNGTQVNGSAVITVTTVTGACQVPARTKLIYLFVGDYVELQGFQDSGGALNTDTVTTGQSHMSILRVSN